MSCPNIQKLVLYMENVLAEDEYESIARHMESCLQCSANVENLGELVSGLSADPGEFEDVGFASDVIKLVHLGQAKKVTPLPQRTVDNRTMGIIVLAAAMVITGFFTVIMWRSYGDELSMTDAFQTGYRSRGAQENTREQGVSIQVFRKVYDGYKTIGKQIRPNEVLAFSYENRYDDQCTYLMIFALDSRGNVFWYYPSYVEQNVFPASVPIERTMAPKQLPDAIEHELNLGPLSLIALFLRGPINVGHVEDSISMQMSQGIPFTKLQFDFDHCGTHTIPVLVSNTEKVP